MSKTVQIASPGQFSDLLKNSSIVVTDCECTPQPHHADRRLLLQPQQPLQGLALITGLVYADWCGPCKQIAPIYEQLSASLSRPNHITFVKVNVDTQKEIASKYSITAYVNDLYFLQGLIRSLVSTYATDMWLLC